MQDILKRINAVAGVIGSLACDADGALVASAFPASFDPAALAVVARTGAQTAAAAHRTSRARVLEICATYEGGRFIVQNMRTGYLCILCGPQINIPLLSLTTAAATTRLPDMISQGAAEPVARTAPRAPDALDALSGFVEALVAEIASRGIGREQLLAILKRRLERLTAARPVLGAIAIDGGRVDLTAIRSRPSAEMATAVALVVTALCQTCTGILGQEATEAAYSQVYEPFQRQNEGLLRTLNLDRILGKAGTFAGGPLPGIEFQL